MSEKMQFRSVRPKKKSQSGVSRFSSSLLWQTAWSAIFSRFFRHPAIIILPALTLPFCASSAWREGFTNHDSLQLVGEGRAKADLPQIQATAMAREAAIMDAMSHWPRYCGDKDATEFRIENQKKRLVDCDREQCRARIVIEKTDLRTRCGG